MSSRTLSNLEESILKKGLKYGIKNKRVDSFEILTRFEQMARSFNKLETRPNNNELLKELDTKNAFFQKLQTMAFEFIELSKNTKDNLTDAEHSALNLLAKDKSIIITKADKGNAVVIQDLSDYTAKVNLLLTTDNKFNKLNDDPTLKREATLQRKLYYLHKTKKAFSKIEYKRIYPSGSKAGIIYGLPKIHKEDAPLRPIISSIGTYNYHLAKYLVEILNPLTDDFPLILKDSFDFINRVSQLDHDENQTIASFDVVSLFTNIPVNETIEIILDKCYDKKSTNKNDTYHGLERKDLKALLEICTKHSHFQFQGDYYEQCDGVSMGSPLGPLFANMFMGTFEDKHMEELTKLGVEKWLRYVDDIFVILKDSSCHNKILDYINDQHISIQFTVELEKNESLPFLDIRVKKHSKGFVTSMYQKSTFTGVYLNWTSLTSRKYKLGLIYCIMDRIWKICSDTDFRQAEIKKLKTNLLKNEYPSKIIDQEIEKFINNRKEKINKENINNNATNNNPDEINNNITQSQPEIITKTIVLPYTNKADEFSKRLKDLVKNSFKNVEFRVAFKTPNEIGKMFPFKDKISDPNKLSNVVYYLKCNNCDANYIGETSRTVGVRMKEHATTDKASVVNQHLRDNPGHVFNFEDVQILDTATSDYQLQLKEMLHCKKIKPSLNTQITSDSYQIKTYIIGNSG